MLKFLKRLLGSQPINPPAIKAEPGRSPVPADMSSLESQQHFDHLVGGVRDYAIILIDRQGNIASWNEGAECIKGYRAEEIVGQHFSRFYPAEAIASGWPAHELDIASATGRLEDEGWRVRKDGSRFWASVVITALRDETGVVRGFLKITRDLTDRKQAEEELRLSEERFRLLVEGVQEYAIFMLDPQGRVTTWNIGAEKIKGYTASEIIGQHFSRFFPPEDLQSGKPQRELEVAAATGKYEEEGWRIRKDGSRFWASVVITPVRDEHGIVRGFSKVTRDMTERKQADDSARRLLEQEAARRGAETGMLEAQRAQREERHHREQLRVTLSSIGDAVIVTDLRGRVTFLNPVAQHLTGWQAHDAAGHPLEDVFRIVNEETRLKVESPVTKVLREGVTVGLANHTVLITKDGREIPIDDSGAPIRGEEGTLAGVVLVFRDVTEARRAIEARLHIAAIVDSSDDAIISKNLDGIILSWNPGAERLYGYTAQEAVGQPVSILIPPEHPDELPEIMDRMRRGERIEHYETVRMRKGGDKLQVSLSISPIKNAEGKIIAVSKIARDITASKRTEDALRFLADAGKLLGELFDAPATLQKAVELGVPRFADWIAVDLVERNGSLRCAALVAPDPAKVGRRDASKALYAAQPEVVVDTREDPPRPVSKDERLLGIMRQVGVKSYIVAPLIVRGKTSGLVTFAYTDSGRRYEAGHLWLVEEFAQRIAVATENAQLYSQLRDADRRKDEFLAMLAHELRNPLAPIRNALQIIKLAGVKGEAAEQACEITERQVEHMVRLVDDLLDVNRIMRGHIELRKEAIELASVIQRAIETAQPMLDAQGQELVLSLPREAIWLDADPTRVAQVIANLLHNAAKFSQRAGHIWLTAERSDDEAVLRVRDEGVGIPPDILPHVFDLFLQGDKSLERTRGGLGIGLTVVLRLVEMHGGTVAVSSQGPGRGSEFVVRLPAFKEAPSQGKPKRSVQPVEPAAPRRVLVVDDNVDAAEVIGMLLRRWGHEVRIAYNGPDALEAAEKYQPEVVVLDIGLPGMNGYEVAQRLRQRPELQTTVLAAVTGYGQDSDRARSHEVGFDHHLTKPVSPEVLQRIVAGSPSSED